MRTFFRTMFGALAFAAVVAIGATALTTSDASARPLGSHMHGHGHHGHHMHGHHNRHSFRHFRYHRYHYHHYRHWHRHWHWRWHRYRHWHRYHYWYRYDRPYHYNNYNYDYGYRGHRYPSYGSGAAPAARPSEPCNCLTKEYLSDGSILFKDLCTKEEAITPARRR